MKAVIALCVKDMVINKFGEDKWRQILAGAGMDKEPMMMPISDIEDDLVLKMVGSVSSVLGLDGQQVADAFGDYWVNEYAPKIYSSYYQGVTSAREFLLKMDRVHELSTKNIKNARPPRFDYHWRDDRTLIMTYKSNRGLIDFCVGLIKGVGRYYKEDLQVRKLDEKNIEIIFPKA